MVGEIVGIGTVIFSATIVFISLQNAFNNIWDLKSKPDSSVIKYLLNRMLSFAILMSIGFMVLVTIDNLILIIEKYVSNLLSDLGMILVYCVNLTITLLLLSLVFGLIFKFLPDAKIQWKQVHVGGFFTAILFVLGKYLLGFF